MQPDSSCFNLLCIFSTSSDNFRVFVLVAIGALNPVVMEQNLQYRLIVEWDESSVMSMPLMIGAGCHNCSTVLGVPFGSTAETCVYNARVYGVCLASLLL